MVNIQDFIATSPFAKRFTVDELLFAEFKCPIEEKSSSVWWKNNFFAHVLTGETLLKTPRQQYILKKGDSVFAKKGSVISHNHLQEDFCELLIFVPDNFIKSVIKKHEISLTIITAEDPGDTIIPLVADNVLNSYFQSLLTHFLQTTSPSEALLKLKFEELLLNIISNNNHLPLKYYFNEICRSSKPSVKEIMEVNFFSNLSLDEFAQICSRSLSSFKKEFHTIFNTTPGRWLQEKRLEYSRYLLETTNNSIDEICTESGFESLSHFIHVFKKKYGLPPGKYKTQLVFMAEEK